jgi:hypothetical protein
MLAHWYCYLPINYKYICIYYAVTIMYFTLVLIPGPILYIFLLHWATLSQTSSILPACAKFSSS